MTPLIGGPPKILAGRLYDLRRSDAVNVDIAGVEAKLAKRTIYKLALCHQMEQPWLNN
jgi:hypothetical protein